MSSYTKITPPTHQSKNSLIDNKDKNNPLKLKIMQTKRDTDMVNFNDYTSSFNPFPRFGSPPVLRYMNQGSSASVNPSINNIQRSESKDINNDKIQYKIINNYHKVFLKEKNKKYPNEYISNLVKLLGKKDKNYKLKRMLLSGKEEEEEEEENDFSSKLSQITQNVISNNLTKLSSSGKIKYEHSPILETNTTEEGNLNTNSKIEESSNQRGSPNKKGLKISANQQTTDYKEMENLNKNLSSSKGALDFKIPRTTRDENRDKPRGLSNLNTSHKENNQEKTKSTIELEHYTNLNSTEQNKKTLKLSNTQVNKNNQSTTAITNKNSNNNMNYNKTNKYSDFSSKINFEGELEKLEKLMKLAQEIYSSQEFLSKDGERKSANRNNTMKSVNFAIEENKKTQKNSEQQANKQTIEFNEEPNNSNIYKYFRVFEDKQSNKSPFPKIEKRYFIKKENDERKIKQLKQKEERLDKLFIQELDYSKILKENIESLKSKFNKPIKHRKGDLEKFCSFYGKVRDIKNSCSENAFPDKKMSFDVTDNNQYYNPNYCNFNQSSKNNFNLFVSESCNNIPNYNLSKKGKFNSIKNLNAISSNFNINNERASEIDSSVKTKNYYSSTVLKYKQNKLVKKNNNNKNSFEDSNEGLNENKILSGGVNNSNLFFESDVNNCNNKRRLNSIDFNNSGLNSDYEVGSQYGKKDKNVFIPIIKKKELYSSPKKDKYSFK